MKNIGGTLAQKPIGECTDPSCKICGSPCRVIQREYRNSQIFTVLSCRNCGTFQTLEHHGLVSPDYVDLSSANLSAGHIEMGRYHKSHAYRQWTDILSDNGITLNRSSCVVDVGCGTGGFLEFLSTLGVRAIGFDASQGQTDYCRSQQLDAEHAMTTLAFLRLRPEFGSAANMVTLWDVFEHIRNPFSFLEDTKKLLSKHGCLFISVPAAGAHIWKRPLHRAVRGAYSFDPWEHVFYYNPRSLSYVLNKSGFECIDIGSVVCYRRPLSLAETVRRVSFAALSAFPDVCPQIYALARVRDARPERDESS